MEPIEHVLDEKQTAWDLAKESLPNKNLRKENGPKWAHKWAANLSGLVPGTVVLSESNSFFGLLTLQRQKCKRPRQAYQLVSSDNFSQVLMAILNPPARLCWLFKRKNRQTLASLKDTSEPTPKSGASLSDPNVSLKGASLIRCLRRRPKLPWQITKLQAPLAENHGCQPLPK